jgi:Ca2+-binding EF-hand superfamily protein
MFRFISKAQSTITPEQLKEFEASFAHFDKDNSGMLDRIEFKAALSALSVPFKDENAFNIVFNKVAEGDLVMKLLIS